MPNFSKENLDNIEAALKTSNGEGTRTGIYHVKIGAVLKYVQNNDGIEAESWVTKLIDLDTNTALSTIYGPRLNNKDGGENMEQKIAIQMAYVAGLDPAKLQESTNLNKDEREFLDFISEHNSKYSSVNSAYSQFYGKELWVAIEREWYKKPADGKIGFTPKLRRVFSAKKFSSAEISNMKKEAAEKGVDLAQIINSTEPKEITFAESTLRDRYNGVTPEEVKAYFDGGRRNGGNNNYANNDNYDVKEEEPLPF